MLSTRFLYPLEILSPLTPPESSLLIAFLFLLADLNYGSRFKSYRLYPNLCGQGSEGYNRSKMEIGKNVKFGGIFIAL
jgi:hypothetical protein